jgi:D-alanine--D-alanine ligase
MIEDVKILICYNAPVSVFSVYNGKHSDEETKGTDLSEKSFIKELNRIKNSLSKYYKDVDSLAIDRDVQKTINNINSFNPDIIYNFVESVEGISSYEWCMTGLFQLLSYEFTGCTPITLGNCLNKDRTNSILNARNITTPKNLVLKPKVNFSANDISLNYPIILKLNSEDASIGISEFSVVNNYKELRKQFNFLAKTYNQNIILEEYIVGRELNVAILDNNVLPISEIAFDELPKQLPKIVTYDSKWIDGSVYYRNTKPVVPANLNERTRRRVEKVALTAYEALNCRDYARIDIRLNKKGVPFVIEVNPNPDISSDSGFARAGMIRRLKQDDVKKIEGILKLIPIFKDEEIKVAMELVNVAASEPKQTDYNVFVYDEDGMIIGYHCIGRRPLTDGVYDLYWIVTDPNYSKKGIGKKLLEHAEQFVEEKNGRWLIAETSSKDIYTATRNFYMRNNYSIISEINDFYSVGDGLVVFGKYFNHRNN